LCMVFVLPGRSRGAARPSFHALRA
jgi:hypothetical protein